MNMTKLNMPNNSFRLCIFFLLALLVSCKSNGMKENKPDFPIPNEKTTVELTISVLANVNSTEIVSGSLLKVFESTAHTNDVNESKLPLREIRIEGKAVQLQLQIGKHYDFVLESNGKLAASLVTNLQARSDMTSLSIIQLEKRLPNREAFPPQLTSFYMIGTEGKVELKNGTRLTLPLDAKVHASVFTRGGAAHKLFNRDFAAKLGLGSTPSSLKLNSHPFLQGIEAESSEGSEKDDGWQNNFTFKITGHNMGGKKDVDFVLVCYDVAGNRLEHHTIVNFDAPKYQAYPKDDIQFHNIHCDIKTTHSFMHLYSDMSAFSVQSPNHSYLYPAAATKKSIYYFPNFSFEVMQDYATEIVGVELFRRCKEEKNETYSQNRQESNTGGANSHSFMKVSEVLYDRARLGKHLIVDTYGGLQIGKIYEYKLRILLQSGFYVESQLIPLKMMLPFEVKLLVPSNHQKLTSLDEFSFKVMTENEKAKDIFSSDAADYFAFGLIIHNFAGERVFWNAFKYYLDTRRQDDERLEFCTSSGEFFSLKELKERYSELQDKTLQDFVNVDGESGIVTIKKDALLHTNGRGNGQYLKAVPYYWDIAFCQARKNGAGIEAVPCAFFKQSKIGDATLIQSSHANIVLATSYTTNGAFAFSIDGSKDESSSTQSSYIVKMKEGCSFDFLQRLNAKVADSFKIDSKSGEAYYRLVFDSVDTKGKTQGKCSEDILFALLSCDQVISAEYDSPIEPIESVDIEGSSLSFLRPFAYGSSTPKLNDPLLRSLCYSLDVTGAFKAYNEFGFGENKVMASIMDTGVNASHEDFVGTAGSIIKKIDEEDVFDNNGHGTHCAGIIAACGNNHVGIAGVSWKNTELFVLKLVNHSTFETYKKISNFIDYVEARRGTGEIKQNTIPLNMSFGSPVPHLIALEVIEKALNAGVLPIVAMGNSGSVLINYPAAYPGVVAVGSTNGKDELSYFSSKGEHISIVAPGEAIMSLSQKSAEHYRTLHGTSMAAPFVCGTISYLMSFEPSLNPFQVKTILEDTADKIGSNDAFNVRRGYGRINVYEAVKQARNKEAMKSKFFRASLKIEASPYSPQNIVCIYREGGVCVFCSRFKSDGSVTLKGLLPGKYQVVLNTDAKIERRELILLADSEDDVSIVF